MGNFQVTTLTTCWKFFLQTVHEKGFLKASERDPKKIQRKKKVAVLCNAEKNSIKRIWYYFFSIRFLLMGFWCESPLDFFFFKFKIL